MYDTFSKVSCVSSPANNQHHFSEVLFCPIVFGGHLSKMASENLKPKVNQTTAKSKTNPQVSRDKPMVAGYAFLTSPKSNPPRLMICKIMLSSTIM